jgi:magnesium chelatase subunit I
VEQYRMLLEEGILARAHKNLLYVDEVNLLDSHIVDVILDAAAQGQTLVRRGAMARLFPSQFVLIGSMNPEEGTLRPQIMDRFGLRVWVAPVTDSLQRLEIYRRSQAFRSDPVSFRASYTEGTLALREEISTAREILPHVVIPSSVEIMAMTIIQKLQIPSHRAEITLLEAARARAASDFRTTVTIEDVVRMAPLALRQRRSSVLESYAAQLDRENATIESVMQSAADAVSQEDSRSERESVVRKIERED